MDLDQPIWGVGRRAELRARRSAALKPGWALALLLFAACGADAPIEQPAEAEPASAAPVERDWPAAELRAGGGPGAAELGPGETHVYRLPLEAGQLLRLEVEQHGVDVELVLVDPAGRQRQSADRLINEFGPELILAMIESSGTHRLVVRAFPKYGPGRYQARIQALRPAAGDDRTAAEAYRRFLEVEPLARSSREEATSVWADALATWRRLEEPVLQAEVLARLGRDHFDHGEFGPAARRYREAATLLAGAGEPYWEARLRNGLASCLLALGGAEEATEALTQFRAVVELARASGNRLLEGAALYGLGSAYRDQGEIQKALTSFEEALEVLAADDSNTRPLALHNLGLLHALSFEDPERGRELLLAALDLYRPAEVFTHTDFKARTLKRLGLLAQEAGRLDEARRRFEEALAVPTGFDRCGRATALGSLAFLEQQDGRPRTADARLGEAFEVLRQGPCPSSEVTLQRIVGTIAEGRSEPAAALAAYRRSRDLAAELGDRTRLADSLTAIARTELALGLPEEALASNRRALAILEELRPTVLRDDLRAAFFSTAQDAFDLQIGLLTGLGSEEEAWVAAERARAQALRDLLLEAGAGLRSRTHPDLAERERTLQRQLNYLESGGWELGGEKLRARRREVDDLVARLERVRGEIRRRSPSYSALTAPEPLSLAEVRRDLLDDGSLLLEYRLGEEESWLWAITRDSFASFSLPARAEVEVVALEAARWTRSLQWPGHNPPPVCELSRLLLGPVAPLLGGRRLVLVPDGALEAVAFAALPDPAAPGECAEAPPLIEGHEIVHLPSVSALAAQRRSLAARAPAPGWVAVVADPVYGPDDERLGRPAGVRTAGLVRSSTRPFGRLRHSGAEARAILAGVPPGKGLSATGFDASKEVASGAALGRFRVLHFATHGVLHPDQPLLSFLALSGRDPEGRPVEGALYAHEIYELDLPAELVVLSACDTARGREVRGEGLVSGLPRAFLYAGAARVLVSLWAVEDRGTGELMDRLYRGLIDRGLPPARALQEAQRSLWRAGHPPHRWAGFVLQGDWRPLPPFEG